MALQLHRRLLSLFILVFTLLTFCYPGPSQEAQSSASDGIVNDAVKQDLRRQVMGGGDTALDPEYRIGYGDIISVSVYGEGSMAVGAQPPPAAADKAKTGKAGGEQDRGRAQGIEVRLDGRSSLLHLGDVPLVGMTVTQAAEYLQQLYKTIYEAPLLTVTLVQSNSRRYTMMGQVASPGLYHLDSPLTMVQAVAKAGGFTEWANHDITVIRPKRSDGAKGRDWGKEGQTFKLDYDDFLKGKKVGDNITLQPDDIVVVH